MILKLSRPSHPTSIKSVYTAGPPLAAEHHDIVGNALLWTLAQGLGEMYSPIVGDTLEPVYDVLAAAIGGHFGDAGPTG